MGSGTEAAFDYLNEGLDGRTEYRFYLDRGVLWIWFYIGADRKRRTTSVACPEVVDASFRADVRQRAQEIVTAHRAGRVLEATVVDRVQVTSTLDELVVAWMKEQEKVYPSSWKTRGIQINNVAKVMKAADDGMMTPLQRLASDDGPQLFVDMRMRERDKETVKKEITPLFQFLEWCKRKQYVTAIPPRPAYRSKDLGTRVGPQRSEPVHLEDEVALQIINRLPEYASRGGRKDVEGAKLPEKAFVCRDMMRFALETGLRPSTVQRLRVGTHWTRGSSSLRVTADIDKGRNTALRGKARIVPLTKVAQAILEKHAPEVGVIFGKHDIRVQWKRAAIAVLGEDEGVRCAPYDLRHAANYRMRSTVGGALGGAMHLVGHSKATTNDLYMRGSEKAAAEVVAALDARNAELEPVRTAVRKGRRS